MLDNDMYWLAFASLKQASSAFIQKLYEHFGDIETAWNADISELIKIENITKKQLDNFVFERNNISPNRCFDEIKSRKINYITFDNKLYPSLLKEIQNPPMTIFYLGDLNRCNFKRTLGIVGSRKASSSIKEILSNIIADFKLTDVCIVSGLAAGIDTVAHKAAIDNSLSTIAVIASGFDFVYPSSNKKLSDQIIQSSGIIMSEYWPSFEPLSWRFPHRNRIVSGLSNGILVAEAALKSGALITAGLALEQGRELMCIPGLITNPNTEGIYKLLKTGASLVTNSSDILEALNWEKIKNNQSSNESRTNSQLSVNDALVLEAVSRDSLNFDDIIIRTGLNIADLMVILTRLEIRGLIKQTDGEKYISLLVH